MILTVPMLTAEYKMIIWRPNCKCGTGSCRDPENCRKECSAPPCFCYAEISLSGSHCRSQTESRAIVCCCFRLLAQVCPFPT